MTENNRTQVAEVIERRGYQIRLTHAGLEWIAAVALPERRPTLIVASERATAIHKVKDWIDLQPAPDRTSE